MRRNHGGGGILKFETFPEKSHQGLPHNERWKICLDYIENHEDEYEQIFTVDTRDVIFQDNVFKNFSALSSYLGYAAEADDFNGTKTGNRVNYGWLANVFGIEEAERFIKKPVICCGTIIGTTREMKIFLQKIIECIPDNNLFGADQATEQHLIYNNLIPIENIIEIDCQTGAILTSSLFYRINPVKLEGDYILRGDGKIPAVVHQYDRQPSLVQLVDKIYREKLTQPDERFTDAKSSLDQMPHLIAENFSGALNFFFDRIYGKNDLSVEPLIKIWQDLSKRELSPEFEILIVALQQTITLALSQNFDPNQMHKFCGLIESAIKSNVAVSVHAKINLGILLCGGIEQLFQAKNFVMCYEYARFLEMLNFPMSQDFYLKQAEICRQLGKKDEAVEAYKKSCS